MKDTYYENINIDITQDSVKLSYTEYHKNPEPKPPKSIFILSRDEEMTPEEFRVNFVKSIQELLPKLFDGSFREEFKQ